ncbi:hypothetical protein [Microbaculum sp. FT89]|uniref:hypothetical protein n=1 Tax=Microbaculum sp. FT89 TaxID=3447298 RepID=UPI003F53D323
MIYPGDTASLSEIIELAEEFRLAANTLVTSGRKGKPLSRAPGRLVAIHAIELFLNAYLLHIGQSAQSIRGMQHDLKIRVDAAAENGLVLRKRTKAHISSLAANREYLVSRYGPEMTTSLSQINRLMATLEEIATKVLAAAVLAEQSQK